MTHPKLNVAQSNPFEGLKIEDSSILNTLENRYACQKCNKSRKYFCYSCFIAHPQITNEIPKVKLPIKIDIIKHRREIDGKSTAAHAAILASDDVKIYTYPDIPSYDDGEKVVLIFPSRNAIEITRLFESNDVEEAPSNEQHRGTLMKNINFSSEPSNFNVDSLPIDRAVFIDSTWNQSRGIYKDERVRKLRCVVLQNRVSQFWRHQKGSPRWYLATIEAVHQFVLEVHLNAWGVRQGYDGLRACFSDASLQRYEKLVSGNARAYSGDYDNLLYFFQHMYQLIHLYYDHDDLYAYTRRMM